jgi:WhiB family redox-sensing transcriptional regulator
MGDNKNFSELPSIVGLAERVRAGETIPMLAVELKVSPATLYNRFSSAGFSSTGETKRDEALREMRAHLKSVALRWVEPWMSEGVCASADPEAWFPEVGQNPVQAKRICAECPAVQSCLEYALSNKERSGIWGGKTPTERYKIAKQRGVAA